MNSRRESNPCPPNLPPKGPYSVNNLSLSKPPPPARPVNNIPANAVASLPSSPNLGYGESGSITHYFNLTKESLFSDIRPSRRRPLRRRPWFWVAAAATMIGIITLIVCVVLAQSEARQRSSEISSESAVRTSSTAGPLAPQATQAVDVTVQYGSDGSTVTKEDGSTFTYRNSFGGYWVSNPEDPFDNSARPNSWTPPLNQSWQWGTDRVNGVNLGGLFVLEPFIAPSIFEDNPTALDEWTLSTSLAEKGQLQQVLEDHYNTFITEEDIAEIAGAGLNWIRLPIPFWAVETWLDVGQDGDGQTVAEPFLAKVCWKYILRVLSWARKYGLRVLLDLHTIPGSQNAYNHSGKFGLVNWLHGTMGLANAERSLDYIRVITEFISQPEYKDLVPMFGVINEPFMPLTGRPQLESFYYEVYQMIRNITGIGEGNGPMIVLHTGFDLMSKWAGFLSGADRIVLDDHPYFVFNGSPNRELVNVTASGSDGSLMGGKWPKQACASWGASHNASRQAFGVTVAGEFSSAINDCGLYVNGVNDSATYGDNCEYWMDSSGWSDETKEGLLNFALASMDALGDWFFWTWKVGNSSTTNTVQSPLWSYKLGLEGGWIPKDPRDALGACAKFGISGEPFDGPFEPWQTGGAGAGTIAPSATQSIPQWPPSLQDVPTKSSQLVPQYTSAGAMPTLPPLMFGVTSGVSPTASMGNGWANPADVAPAVIPIAGCAYPFAWDGVDAQIPVSGCVPAP